MFTPNAPYNAPYNTPFVPPSLSFVDEEDALSLFRHYLLLADQSGARSFEAILEHTSDSGPCLSFSCDGRYEELLEYRRNSPIVPISPRREYRSPDRLDGPISPSGSSEPSYTFPEIIIDIPLANDELFRKFGNPRIFVDEVAGLFQTLNEGLDMYLLFLKHVTAIELRVMGDSRIIRARIPTAARGYRVVLMEALSPGMEKTGLVYRTEVVRSVGTYKASTTEWYVSLHGPDPGVGIAVLLSPKDKETDFSGRILDPLPSLLDTGQPVHIYGSFQSVDGLAERQENSVLSYRSSQLREYPSPEELVAQCWVTFLLDISPKLGTSEAVSNDYFRYWPKSSSQETIRKIYRHVFSIIFERNLPLWPTALGLKGISDVFISRLIDQNTRLIVGNKHLQHLRLLEKGLARMNFQLTHVPDEIYDTMERMNPNRKILTPVSLSVFLSTHLENLIELEDDIKGALLDYLLSRPLNKTFDYLIGIPLIPTCDGEWKSLGYLSSLKLPYDEREIHLFSKKSHTMVDIRRISHRAFLKLQTLESDKLRGSLQPWAVKDMAEYLKSFYFQNITDQRITIDGSCLGPEFPGFVNEFWKWITKLPESEDMMKQLEGLWLIPLEGQQYHQISLDACCSRPLDLANPSSSFGSFILSLLERGSSRSDLLVLHREFSEAASDLLSHHHLLWDSGNFEHVLHWLSNPLDFIASLTTPPLRNTTSSPNSPNSSITKHHSPPSPPSSAPSPSLKKSTTPPTAPRPTGSPSPPRLAISPSPCPPLSLKPRK
ncbi:hypothetical protein FPQ18DRAFT_30038 [Pyronema domesticum]|nr:hypothetical protein FPQ18DRAFT_30038 [Pyronema domesticum]